jgi:hypothetical protein
LEPLVPDSRVPGSAPRCITPATTAQVIYRLIGRDIPLHSLGAILTTFDVRRVEASRSGRGATGCAGAGPAASIARVLAALNSVQTAHAACVFSGSACSECSRA